MAFCVEDIELGDDTSLLAELVACWRASVEATHTFLTPDDIERIAGYVPGAIASVAHLTVCRDESDQVAGFIGVDGAMIEMLFIHPSLRGCGLGPLLLDHAISEHGVTLVDVNEQNEQAVGFYEHCGFEVFDRLGNRRHGRPLPHPTHALAATARNRYGLTLGRSLLRRCAMFLPDDRGKAAKT